MQNRALRDPGATARALTPGSRHAHFSNPAPYRGWGKMAVEMTQSKIHQPQGAYPAKISQPKIGLIKTEI